MDLIEIRHRLTTHSKCVYKHTKQPVLTNKHKIGNFLNETFYKNKAISGIFSLCLTAVSHNDWLQFVFHIRARDKSSFNILILSHYHHKLPKPVKYDKLKIFNPLLCEFHRLIKWLTTWNTKSCILALQINLIWSIRNQRYTAKFMSHN